MRPLSWGGGGGGGGTNGKDPNVFCTHKEKLIQTKDHELNCLAYRSRAILPTFVGLCFFAASLLQSSVQSLQLESKFGKKYHAFTKVAVKNRTKVEKWFLELLHLFCPHVYMSSLSVVDHRSKR